MKYEVKPLTQKVEIPNNHAMSLVPLVIALLFFLLGKWFRQIRELET